jgi:hypothetical protein
MELEHQRCYVYQPNADEERPSKRQRIGKASFQPQLKERIQTYRALWAEQEQRIQVIPICIHGHHVTNLDRILWKKPIVPRKEVSSTLLLRPDHHQTSQNSPYLPVLLSQDPVLHLMDLILSDWGVRFEQIQTAPTQF